MALYTVTAVNNSTTSWKFFVYQAPVAGQLSLAWFVSPSIPNGGGFTAFFWQTNYQFVCADTGRVEPGKVVKVSGEKNCDPDGANTTTFTVQDGTQVLSDPTPGNTRGTLYIFDASSTPANTYAVGIGMSGSPTFVQNAGPNFQHPLTPQLAYYIAAIEEVEQGEIMDTAIITKRAPIVFPPNLYNMTATFRADNTWSIVPSSVGQGAKDSQVDQVDQVAKGAKVK